MGGRLQRPNQEEDGGEKEGRSGGSCLTFYRDYFPWPWTSLEVGKAWRRPGQDQGPRDPEAGKGLSYLIVRLSHASRPRHAALVELRYQAYSVLRNLCKAATST